MKKLMLLLCFALLLSENSFAKLKTYALDPDYSNAEFRVRHLAGKIKGRYDMYKAEGKFEYDGEKPDKLKIWGKLDAASISTGNEKQDTQLKSSEFFDVSNSQNPQNKWIIFESSKFADLATVDFETKGKLHGKITIHSVTQPIVLNATVHGKPMVDPSGNERIAVSVEGTFNRKDFGLTWNQAVETGGLMFGDTVGIALELEAIVKSTSAVFKDEAKKNETKIETKVEKKEEQKDILPTGTPIKK